jgi:S1-C subfamily serine protease
VTGVDPDGAALTGGVQPDDLILTINREPITSASGAIRALNRVPSGSTAFLVIVRGDSRVLRRLRKE